MKYSLPFSSESGIYHLTTTMNMNTTNIKTMSLCQKESMRQAIHMKTSSDSRFNFMQMKVIFLTMVSLLDSY